MVTKVMVMLIVLLMGNSHWECKKAQGDTTATNGIDRQAKTPWASFFQDFEQH